MRSSANVRMPEQGLTDDSTAALLGRWVAGMREIVLQRLPEPADEREIRRQLAASAVAMGRAGRDPGSARGVKGRKPERAALLPIAALALWRLLYVVVEGGLDLFGEDDEARSILAEQIEPSGGIGDADHAGLLHLARGFLASEGRCPVTPERFGTRLQRRPPDRLELPDGITLSGASLTAFL